MRLGRRGSLWHSDIHDGIRQRKVGRVVKAVVSISCDMSIWRCTYMNTEGSNPSPSTKGGKEQSNGLANRLIARSFTSWMLTYAYTGQKEAAKWHW